VKAVLESQAVFLRLNDLPGFETARTLELEIDRNGKPIAAERFELGTVKKGDLEILSRQPELLARAHKAVEKAGERVRLTVLLDGIAVREMPFQEAVAASRRLQQNGLAPVALPSWSTDPSRSGADPGALTREVAKDSSPDPQCVQECYDTWGYCSSVEMENCGCYPHCVDQCINSCPWNCTDPLSVSERTVVQIVGATLVDYYCYEDWGQFDFVHGHYYHTYWVTYKHTRIRTTRHCDMSVTEEVIDVYYTNGYCSDQDYWNTCSYPFGPYNYPPAFSC
jgi:hypothetical protein